MNSPVTADVRAAFGLERAQIVRHGSGHIHATFRAEGPAGPLLLQRINTRVFPDPERLCANAARVAAYLQARSPGYVPQPVRSTAGGLLVTDRAGQLWRALSWIDHARTYDVVSSAAVAREAGRAFGRWHRLLADFATDFNGSIPGFLDLTERLGELAAAQAEAAETRVDAARELLDLISRLRDEVNPGLVGPRRVLHADCKVNNVLFDAVDRAIAVVDLDTVMPGPVALDFGDLARSVCAGMPEDEADPARVGFDPARFAALVEGFLAETAALLDAGEVAGLGDAPAYMAFMLGVRFLTDHLRGDRYFGVSRPAQNLDRARAQLYLAQAFVRARAELGRLIAATAAR